MRNYNSIIPAAFLLIVCLVSCKEEGQEHILPTSADAAFNYSIDAGNPNVIHFSATPLVDTWYTHWNFGDGTGAEGYEATKTYFDQGNYDVRFRIFTEGGYADSTQTIVIANNYVDEKNIVKNGTFSSDEYWDILQISPGMDISIAEGKATWMGGSGGHAGIYQAVEVEAGVEYQVEMNISGSGATDSWFEIYAGKVEPQQGVDYSDGGMLLGLNTWSGCGDSPFDGLITDLSCNGGDGSVTFSESGTIYLVIRGGGNSFGADGISIDNVEMRSE